MFFLYILKVFFNVGNYWLEIAWYFAIVYLGWLEYITSHKQLVKSRQD